MNKKEWDKVNTTDVRVKLNNRTDKDLLEYLAKQPSKQGAIKTALRKQIQEEDKEKAP